MDSQARIPFLGDPLFYADGLAGNMAPPGATGIIPMDRFTRHDGSNRRTPLPAPGPNGLHECERETFVTPTIVLAFSYNFVVY